MSAFFELKNLSVAYGKVEAVHALSLHVDAGQIITIIGPNGAGKTTCLGAAMGLLPSRGSILFDGEDIGRLGIEDRVERGFCLVPERRELFGDMSVADNLQLGAYPHRRDRAGSKRDFDSVYERFPRLAERRAQRASTLSGGERQMLALGRALMARPRFLMLDEPSLGLAPLIVREVLHTVARLRDMIMLISRSVLPIAAQRRHSTSRLVSWLSASSHCRLRSAFTQPATKRCVRI